MRKDAKKVVALVLMVTGLYAAMGVAFWMVVQVVPPICPAHREAAKTPQGWSCILRPSDVR
jgi:hypothetical protein